MAAMKEGCVKPARGVIAPVGGEGPRVGAIQVPEERSMQARVGKEAPDFEANAFVDGEGFKPIKLSDFRGSWIVLCFYPGDFTFV